MTLRLDASTRAQLAELKRAEREIKKPLKDAQRHERREQRKSREADRVKFEKRPFPGAEKPTRPKVDDGSGYMGWLHDGLHCIACLVLHEAQPRCSVMEAAHQKLQLADRGFHKRAGRRGPHWTCVPLCRLHHRDGPLRCDPAQSKFWSIIGLEPERLADFIEALNAAYRGGSPGNPIIHSFAELALRNRARAA